MSTGGADVDWASQCLADLLDRANAPIFAIDLDGAITEWNERIAQLTGYAKNSTIGEPLSPMIHKSSQKVLQDTIALAMSGEMGPPIEVKLRTAGCGCQEYVFKLSLGLSPQFGLSEKVVGILCVGQVAAEPARATAGSFKTVKGMVMHELRSPLHGIIGLANTLSQDESPMQKPLKMIGSSAERVQEQVTNLMDYWNLSEESMEDLALDAIDINMVINESLTRCESAKDKRGRPMKKDKVSISKEVSSDMPTIMGDQQAITQMVCHLIMNALKFTHQGHVKISVTYKSQTSSINIAVEDTGIGIGQANIQRVFEPFQQEDTSESRKYEGIGLGLAIVREVVRVHKGTVSVDSTPERGSTFHVSLPINLARTGSKPEPASSVMRPRVGPRNKPSSWLGPADLLKPPPAPAQAKPAKAACEQVPVQEASAAVAPMQGFPPPVFPFVPPVRQSQRVIMSVDDDHVNQEVMRSVLEPCGFSIVICMSGAECLEYMEKEDAIMPELILLDLMMPGINGFDVLQEQRKKITPEQLPIIMVSAKNQASSVVKGLELGCNDWIHKPFDRQELIARVKTHLRWRDNMLHMQLMAAAAAQADKGAVPVPMPELRAKPALEFAPIVTSIDTSVLFVSITDQGEGDASLTRLFEVFEVLSEKHGAVRTEIMGSSYIAVARSSDDEKRHTDKMLHLALGMEEAVIQLNRESVGRQVLQFKLGIHTDSHVPPVIDGRNGKCPRQYPITSFYGATVRGAKRLLEGKVGGGSILLSRSARCRLSADIENEMRDRGLQMLSMAKSGEVGGDSTDHYCLMKLGSTMRLGAGDPGLESSEVMVRRTASLPSIHTEQQEELQQLQQELQAAKRHAETSQHKLRSAEEQLAGCRTEASSLRMQLEELRDRQERPSASQGSLPQMHMPMPHMPQMPRPSVPTFCSDGPSSPLAGSTLFLQWQNAHLQAELRYYQEALALAKGQLQMQTLRSQAMERRQGVLQERIEHLELDLGFKAACNGFMGPGLSGELPFGGDDGGVGVDAGSFNLGGVGSNGAVPEVPSMLSGSHGSFPMDTLPTFMGGLVGGMPPAAFTGGVTSNMMLHGMGAPSPGTGHAAPAQGPAGV